MKTTHPKRVSGAELARLTDYSAASITNFVHAGILHRGSDHKFDLVTALEAIRAHEASRQQSGKRPESSQFRQRYWEARTGLIEVKLAKERGEVHSEQECSASLGQVLTSVWTEIKALPCRVQAAFPEIPGLETAVVNLVNDAAQRLQDFAKQNSAHIASQPPDVQNFKSFSGDKSRNTPNANLTAKAKR
jgi:phage terminase Nu1 subunit (DNA packaging protein)